MDEDYWAALRRVRTWIAWMKYYALELMDYKRLLRRVHTEEERRQRYRLYAGCLVTFLALSCFLAVVELLFYVVSAVLH
jgi:hypothetical protein